MAITLMYITNNPVIAQIAQDAGVDRIWIDLETLGKEERQAGMNTVKSKHSIEDIRLIKPLLDKSELMVRVNPLNPNSESEINAVIDAGAQYVMLPMYRTANDVARFLEYVNGRAKTILLLETIDAQKNLIDYVDFAGIDEIHIGLNDLHLDYRLNFMFELVSNGTVGKIAQLLNEHNIRFGFGGFARIGYGMLPAEIILTDHYALGSQMAILSRGFCDANIVDNPMEIADVFKKGVSDIRKKEQEIRHYSREQFDQNHLLLIERVHNIVSTLNR